VTIKIAAVTEDGVRLSSHFGMAPYYQVFQIEAGKIQAEERRDKPHHAQHGETHQHASGHADMFAPISDCRVLLCGGMGAPAYHKALEAGLEVILIGGEISSALQAYLDGGIISDMRRVHQH
jgi:predicted Fe-Mo cluster-binding NifX family protein